MARGASSTGKGVRRAAPDRQARVGAQKWVWWGSARARGLGPLTRVFLFFFVISFAIPPRARFWLALSISSFFWLPLDPGAKCQVSISRISEPL